MAPQVGLEPTTLRLTAGCSAIELLRSVQSGHPRTSSRTEFSSSKHSTKKSHLAIAIVPFLFEIQDTNGVDPAVAASSIILHT